MSASQCILIVRFECDDSVNIIQRRPCDGAESGRSTASAADDRGRVEAAIGGRPGGEGYNTIRDIICRFCETLGRHAKAGGASSSALDSSSMGCFPAAGKQAQHIEKEDVGGDWAAS